MGGIVTLLAIIYLVGIGVVLAPTVQGEWNAGTASQFFQSILQQLPVAAAWPALSSHDGSVDRLVGAKRELAAGPPGGSALFLRRSAGKAQREGPRVR
jgi:hypothetical protein